MDKPIIFSAPMVRALLDGRKTQTRRIATVVADSTKATHSKFWGWQGAAHFRIPYAPGDRLWVREAWRTHRRFDNVRPVDLQVIAGDVRYEADRKGVVTADVFGRLRPSIHMPRWASRLTLHVSEVRVQRLQEITAEDCTAEGIPFEADALAPYEWSVSRFADLWNSLHGPDAWDANPWVCAITFEVERVNIDNARALQEQET